MCRENLERLLDDKHFKEEIVHFNISEETEVVDSSHRGRLIPVLMRYRTQNQTRTRQFWEPVDSSEQVSETSPSVHLHVLNDVSFILLRLLYPKPETFLLSTLFIHIFPTLRFLSG